MTVLTRPAITGHEQILIKTIADYEGWELNGTIDDAEPLFAAMTAVLPAETIDLERLELMMFCILFTETDWWL